ncbi:nuclease A inhibitor family protein [Brunnivagina elsteri]|uniref:Nuclease n=1 Tax=Brunnivagina elsteri CCALA 953 TaxID=987040 RepID=A0A2A2TCH8_9CYAN|nr:nuclease A inhibitor family protein [Calothrix elsteri]PAX51346.1 nuclease [Calothrix elsteri CCALA 953]
MSDSSQNPNQILLEKLKQASSNLLFPSESEYPFDVFLWKFIADKPEINRELILKQLEKPSDTQIEIVEIDPFFEIATTEQDWHGEEEKETVKKYQSLVKVIKENLTEIKVARIGKIEIDIYILGKTASNDIAGLSTKVIET